MGWLKIFSIFGAEPLTEEEKKIEAEKEAKEKEEKQKRIEEAMKLARQAKREYKQQQYDRMSALFPNGTLMMFNERGSLHVVDEYFYSEELETFIPALINYENWEEAKITGSRINHDRVILLTQIRWSSDNVTKLTDVIAYFRKAQRRADVFVRFLEYLNFKRDDKDKVS